MMSDKMLAAVYYGPNDLRVVTHPVPEIARDEVLLKVISTGICATDIRILHGAHRMYAPGTIRIPGHEVVGDIIQVGGEVKGIEARQRVFVAPNMGCGHCRECISGNNNRCTQYDAFGITIDGSFAEYMRVPAQAILQGNLIPIAEDVDTAAAALIEPFACILRGQDVLHIRPGETVLVVGAGPIGIMHAMLARLRGAGRVIVSELNPERASQATNFNVDRVVNPEKEDLKAVLADETDGQGADVVIIAAPSYKAQEAAMELAALGGRINFFGGLPTDHSTIQLDSNLVHYKELVVTGTTACSTDDCRRAAAIVNAGRIDLGKVISARLPLRNALDAFKSVEDAKSLKVIMEP
jgi:L-iditol 2-dehydrogenase